MRKHYQSQTRFDVSPIAQVPLNLECRDEIIPLLVGLQHIYTNQKLRNKVVKVVAAAFILRKTRRSWRPSSTILACRLVIPRSMPSDSPPRP
jgi:hypothetical protein